MDPVANLEEQRKVAGRIIQLADGGWDDQQQAEEAVRLAELVQALDEWRQKGGFDPYVADTTYRSAIEQGETALEGVAAWERDEVEGDTNLILELEAALSDCLGALTQLTGN